ncbi:hypothetical protein CY0110_16347 [Crocosphaera chwakensis CCY0110]|uniref:Uncharacterized protein n=1 Tax=Crocosphaera chwakensis CCY0110 TaxID=391612 RepID=A3IHV1_9CHRO|nr:hypothetical protein CY0110_16347 [Crocosphaera chwakensis CCY0110]
MVIPITVDQDKRAFGISPTLNPVIFLN